jgi:hypothetical protein
MPNCDDASLRQRHSLLRDLGEFIAWFVGEPI